MSHMTHFHVLLLALGIGVIAGLRTFTAPAVVAWAAVLHCIAVFVDGTRLLCEQEEASDTLFGDR